LYFKQKFRAISSKASNCAINGSAKTPVKSSLRRGGIGDLAV
jgi:hypothetical protein